MIIFFVGVWVLSLYILWFLSKRHSWVIPIFAIGLGAPRWGQMLWGTSNIGLYVPWGSRATGALLGRSLWLWLGVLDNLQGIGFGMILLQTLTRFHVTFSLVAAQVLGSVATIAARATAPDATGPGSVFPNFALGFGSGVVKPWFWGCLCFQLVIPIGFFMFFRKEQLLKP
jgi:alpha-1,3-glucan synthase